QQRCASRLDVAAEYEDVRDVALPFSLPVVRRVDAEVVRRVARVHAAVANERMRVARLRSHDVQLRLEAESPGDPVARVRVPDVMRAQSRQNRLQVRRDGDALGTERDDVVPVELDEAGDGQGKRAREDGRG